MLFTLMGEEEKHQAAVTGQIFGLEALCYLETSHPVAKTELFNLDHDLDD